MTLSKRETATLVFYILSLLILLWISEDRVVPISEATRVKEENQIKYEELKAEAKEFAEDYNKLLGLTLDLPLSLSERPKIKLKYNCSIPIQSDDVNLRDLCEWAEWYNNLGFAQRRYLRGDYTYFKLSDTLLSTIDSAYCFHINGWTNRDTLKIY